MLYPRISGNLYNCAFNCALPSIVDKIGMLAQWEQSNQLPEDSDPIFSNYKTLKSLFLQSYGLSPNEADTIGWQGFYGFLLEYTFEQQEMLFAPVFRLFIAQYRRITNIGGFIIDSLNPDGESLSPSGVCLDTGRYPMLNFPTMATDFYNELGIPVRLLSSTEKEGPYVEQSAESLSQYGEIKNRYEHIESPLKCTDVLDLYLYNEHYELQKHSEVDMPAYLGQMASLTGAFATLYAVTTEDLSAWKTNKGLADLFVEVGRELNAHVVKKAQNFEYYIENGRHLHPSGDEGTLTFAVILLVIAKEFSQDEVTKRSYMVYMDAIERLMRQDRGEAIVLANKVIACKCDLHLLAQNHTNACFNFQFNVFNALVGLGAVLLVVAIVTLPPVATAIGLSALIGAGTAGIVSASAGVSGLSLLAGLGWFACARKLEEGSEFLDKTFQS